MTETGSDSVLGLLVAHRLLVYVGGLVAIATPLALSRGLGVGVSPPIRTAVVAVSLGVMVLTYVGEYRLGEDGPAGSDESGTRYSSTARVAVAAAVLGVVAGVYVALEYDPLVGGLFVVGALLFGQFAFQRSAGRSEP
jgi:hypothetical protein